MQLGYHLDVLADFVSVKKESRPCTASGTTVWDFVCMQLLYLEPKVQNVHQVQTRGSQCAFKSSTTVSHRNPFLRFGSYLKSPILQ